MDKLELGFNPTMRDFQEYVKVLEIERGFEDQNAIEKCLLLGEEMGELFKAVREKEEINKRRLWK